MQTSLRKRLERLEAHTEKKGEPCFVTITDPLSGLPYVPIPEWAAVIVLIPDNGRGDATIPGAQPRRYD